MKDYIYIEDANGSKMKMEIVLSFKLENEPKQYIIYKELEKDLPLYVAKCDIKEEISELDTNLTKEERIIISKIIKERNIG